MILGILSNKRNKIIEALRENQIGLRICWLPAHKQPSMLKDFGKADFPNAEFVYDRVLNLPIGNTISDDDVLKVCDIVNRSL